MNETNEMSDATILTDNAVPEYTEKECMGDKIFDIWERIRLCCYFIPIITTVAFLLSYFCKIPIAVEYYTIVPMTFIGWIAAILTGPIRLIKMFLKVNLTSLKIGFDVVPFFPGCILGAFIAWLVCFAAVFYVCIYAPAAITIFLFVKDEVL